ncbi:MAG: HAD family phosphatase [Lachnospiraceae bacterium]|jgi:putative hydrolase of the HAD superfamily|nr:HAD family phosphatase [Lachnospiraceae bacterium]
MIKNVIFDIGNVLTDFRWAEFLADKGFSKEEVQRIANASVLTPIWAELDRGAWSFEEVMAGFIKNDPEIEKELHQAFDDMTDIVRIRDYAIPWVKELKQKGYSVYYLSNFSEKIERESIAGLAFREEMDGGILSWKEKVIKPDPTIYRLLLERYSLVPEESVFVDDLLVNVEAGRKLGIHGIVFQSKEQVEEELKKLS